MSSTAPAPQDLRVVRVSDDKWVKLQSIWQERRVALIFLRHLGCLFCKEQVDAIIKSGLAQRLTESGTVLVAISLGSAPEARKWITETGFIGELYVDPSTDGSVTPEQRDPTNKTAEITEQASFAYNAFSLKRGRAYHAHEKTNARREQVRQRFQSHEPTIDGDIHIFPGDVFQIGGGFVVGPGNCCDFASRSEYVGDLLDLEALEVAATGQRRNGAEYVYPSTKAWFERLQVATVYDPNTVPLQRRVLHFALKHRRRGAALFVGIVAASWAARARRRRTAGVAAWLGAALVYSDVASLLGFCKRLPRNFDWRTPRDVDSMAKSLGMMQCDCGGVMSSIPMDDKATSEDAGALERRRSSFLVGAEGLGSASRQTCTEYQHMLCYVREFLAKPHPVVGRPGPVCPFVPKSLKLNVIKFSVVRTAHISAHKLCAEFAQLLVDLIPRFEAMEPTTGRQQKFKVVILVFPDVSIEDAADIIDGAHAIAKPHFVPRGLMAGGLHSASNWPGLHNPGFFPLRTPHPCMLLRHMVPEDYVFMTLDAYPPDEQRRFLESFLGIHGDEDRAETRDAREKLQALKARKGS